jgi:hypothetical protein
VAPVSVFVTLVSTEVGTEVGTEPRNILAPENGKDAVLEADPLTAKPLASVTTVKVMEPVASAATVLPKQVGAFATPASTKANSTRARMSRFLTFLFRFRPYNFLIGAL